MSDSAKRIHQGIKKTNALLQFKRISPDYSNIDEVYTNNLNVWYAYNSDHKESKDSTEIVITNGVLENPDNFIFSKTKSGFELSEVDFIDSEFQKFESLDIEKLSLIEKKQYTFYTDFLNKKRISANWNLNDYYNHYLQTKRFGFTFLRTYKANEYNDFINQLKIYKERFDYITNKLSFEDKNEFINDFFDQLEKLKLFQNLTKFIEYITAFIESNKNGVHAFKLNEIYQIDNYKNSYNSFFFKDILNKKNEENLSNDFYFNNSLVNWEKQKNNELLENESLKDCFVLLKIYNRTLSNLINDLVLLFKAIDEYDEKRTVVINRFNLQKEKVFNSLNSIKNYSLTIKQYVVSEKYDLAIKIKNYCSKMLNEVIIILKDFFIDIDKSPLNESFLEVNKTFENSINIDEIKLLKNTSNKVSNDSNLAQLLKDKETLKFQVKRAKEKVDAQKFEVERHKQRAENGQINTLVFEQKQVALFEGELVKLQKDLSSLKISIKTLKLPDDKNINEKHKQIEVKNSEKRIDNHPKFNPNDWNKRGFELFKYLIDNYYNDKRKTNTKLICIWFYLNELNNGKYNLNLTKDNYKILILNSYGVKITNVDKPLNYDRKVFNIIDEHRINFEDSLK